MIFGTADLIVPIFQLVDKFTHLAPCSLIPIMTEFIRSQIGAGERVNIEREALFPIAFELVSHLLFSPGQIDNVVVNIAN